MVSAWVPLNPDGSDQQRNGLVIEGLESNGWFTEVSHGTGQKHSIALEVRTVSDCTDDGVW